MKEIQIYKAQRISPDSPPTESVTIIIDQETPNIEYDGRKEPLVNLYEKAHEYYKSQGEKMTNALLETLPGGTIDEILICLLEYKKSIFKVSYMS